MVYAGVRVFDGLGLASGRTSRDMGTARPRETRPLLLGTGIRYGHRTARKREMRRLSHRGGFSFRATEPSVPREMRPLTHRAGLKFRDSETAKPRET